MNNVYFVPIEQAGNISQSTADLLAKLIEENEVTLEKELPIKIHPGAIGNITYLKPEYYDRVIEYLKQKGVSPFYIETCMEAAESLGKEKEFQEHGFSQLPVTIADGEHGDDDVQITNPNFKHLKYALIAKKIAEAKQMLVVSHFKGHCMAGFGGALKMLGIGCESGRGKTLIHGTKNEYSPGDAMEWEKSHLPGESAKWVKNWDSKYASSGNIFRERVAESAWAAASGKQIMYITIAVNLTNNCDCDEVEMKPVYKDVGIFASMDPVAIDKAVLDILEKREGEKAFEGEEILEYSEKLGLGKTEYTLKALR